ncbi:MAG: hypothetical protein HS108_15960 [Planctomycetes bacterium]|jgi:hypothetical protein|nr:hypothetical protein [Planctomycetota bacterium]
MEWWHYALVAYGAVGLLIAIPLAYAGINFARLNPQTSKAKLILPVVIGGVIFTSLWPLIVLPVLLLARKAKRAQENLGQAAKMAFDAAQRPGAGRVIDVEKTSE